MGPCWHVSFSSRRSPTDPFIFSAPAILQISSLSYVSLLNLINIHSAVNSQNHTQSVTGASFHKSLITQLTRFPIYQHVHTDPTLSISYLYFKMELDFLKVLEFSYQTSLSEVWQEIPPSPLPSSTPSHCPIITADMFRTVSLSGMLHARRVWPPACSLSYFYTTPLSQRDPLPTSYLPTDQGKLNLICSLTEAYRHKRWQRPKEQAAS